MHCSFATLFGERSAGRLLPHTRISPSTCIEHEERLRLGDHVFIGALNFIEASGGITIEEGVQITSHVAIVTHSSHRAMRLLGRAYVAWPGERPGWVAGAVHIGAYSFIGPHVRDRGRHAAGPRHAGARRQHRARPFADFAVLDGRPAVVVGDTRQRRRSAGCSATPKLRAHHDAWAGRDAA